MIDIHIDEDNFDVRHLQHKRVLYAGSMEHRLSNTFRNKDSDSETDEVLTFEDFRAAYRSGNKCCFMASSSLCRH